MKKLLQTMAAVMLAASIVPAYAKTENDEQARMEINKQTDECANRLAPLVTGSLFGTTGALTGAYVAAYGIAENSIIPLGIGGICGIAALACMAKWYSLYNTYKNKFSENDLKAIHWKTENRVFILNFIALGAIGIMLPPVLSWAMQS